jgi:FkbM family methyltransferase
MPFVETPAFGTYAPTPRQARIIAWFHDTPLGLSRLRRRAFKEFLAERAGPVDARLFGLDIRFYPHDNASDAKAAVCGKSFNAAELGWITKALRPGTLFVDIGANMGFFSLYAAKAGARVIAIEPNPALVLRLRANLARSGFDDAIIYECAVGEAAAESRVLMFGKDLGGGHIATGGAPAGQNVPIRPLLDLMNEARIGAIDILKIDIEGYEDRALMPFFASAPPALYPRNILFEHSARALWQADLLGRFAELDYVTRAKSRGNSWIALRPSAGKR